MRREGNGVDMQTLAAEIGRELGLSLPAVLTRLFRARNKLRAIYGLEPAPEPPEESP